MIDQEAINEYVREKGYEQKEREWVLTPYDTWVRNPYTNQMELEVFDPGSFDGFYDDRVSDPEPPDPDYYGCRPLTPAERQRLDEYRREMAKKMHRPSDDVDLPF